MTFRLPWLDPDHEQATFPAVDRALREPDGLLAAGGRLSAEWLLAAYRSGIFPWYSEGQPILWWSPDPRAVLFPERLKVSRSLRRTLKKAAFTVTMDRAFRAVVEACAEPRKDSMGTWITPDMMDAYCRLHELGIAHSVEYWQKERLVGGLYGVAVGRVFFGESMFSRETDASKVAFVHLVRQLQAWGYPLIDCQVGSHYLTGFGAENISRPEFVTLLDKWCQVPGHPPPWQLEIGLVSG